MPTIYAGGHTFEVQTDMMEATSLSRPDTSWRFMDAAGHEHRWHVNGQPADAYDPSLNYAVPTLRYVDDDEYWCGDCGDLHARGHYECVICGEHVTPGRTADTSRHYVRGVSRYVVDGRSVSEDEFRRIAAEAGIGP